MNNLKDLLELALDDGHGSAAGARADARADLARGKRLRRRRARRRMLATAGTTAAVAAAAIVVPTALHAPSRGGTSSHPGIAASTRPASTGQAAATRIRLVAYTGAQPPGYVVKVIPAGWVIQGSTAFSLVIAPSGDLDGNPDSFLGKLVVTQEGFDASGAAAEGWVPASAAGRPAYYDNGQSADAAGTAGLVIEEAPGRWLVVQAPQSLGWTQRELTQFGLGVTILATAQEGHG